MVDASTAFILLVLLAPVALVGACLAYFDVGVPIIFWQRRIGQGGREFMILKFRTYRAPFSRNGAPVSADARLSRIGKALRATRLDEIPQLFNILRGDMSLIGPRPLLPVDQPADPRLRLLVRPGVTGWAQVNGGTLVTPEEKDALDVWYIHHASIKLDCKIILRTLAIVFRGENKENSAVQTAIRWYAKTRQNKASLLGGVADAARSASKALVKDERTAPLA
jgi:lipopolysaccharide/colanic/teichoic acid biosynthesis glycosyltransferase